ncbi:sulfite exporter TauE/SafE family protein [Candidatus Saccharibacteria bacterium]|nr:sulfite exporter TauE/SafE family protein [Candidatus Saccharibacteria bacterium]
MTSLFGMTYIEANATTFVPWVFLSVTALYVFISHNLVNFAYGLSIGMGMAVGGIIGASHALKKGNNWVRLFFIVVIIASVIKLII